MQVALTRISGNAKTGPIPTTTSSRETCPSTCPFYKKGCYAKAGPQNIHWNEVTKGHRGSDWQTFCQTVRKLPQGQLWRHNVSGDLPHVDGIIDAAMVRLLVAANLKKRGFTYTHHALNAANVETIQQANAAGFTINASTESVEAADAIMTHYAIPAIAVVKSTENRRFFRTESGRKVVTCPAALHPGKVTCASCGLCQQSDREFIIAFPAHGNAKKTVDSIVA
jgi:hypothetical protein